MLCNSARVSGRPSPVPFFFVEKNGSKIRSSVFGAMPTPVSRMVISVMSVCGLFCTIIVTSPPVSGSACVALSSKFKMICWSAFALARMMQGFFGNTALMLMFGAVPFLRRRMIDSMTCSMLMSSQFRTSGFFAIVRKLSVISASLFVSVKMSLAFCLH